MPVQVTQRLPLFAIFLSAVLLVAGCGTEPTIGTISAADLAGRIGTDSAPVIFDVRTAEEFAGGHVPGAINLPHTEVAARAAEFATYQDREVVVYCRSGKRAAMAEADLQAAGFTRLLDLAGHMQQWTADRYPLDGMSSDDADAVDIREVG